MKTHRRRPRPRRCLFAGRSGTVYLRVMISGGILISHALWDGEAKRKVSSLANNTNTCRFISFHSFIPGVGTGGCNGSATQEWRATSDLCCGIGNERIEEGDR